MSSTLKKLYTILVVLFPILSIYSSWIPSITLAENLMFFQILLFIIYILVSKKNLKIHLPIFLLAILILFHMILIFLVRDQEYYKLDITLRTIRYILYLIFISVFSLDYFDIKLGFRLLKKVSIFSTIYLLFQVILMKFFNFYLSGFLPIFSLMNKDYELELVDRFYILQNLDRPYSIFSEPSHYAIYVILFYTISLFSKDRKQILSLLFIVLGIVLSRSATGYLMLTVLTLLIILNMFKDFLKGKNVYKFLFSFIFSPIILLMFIITNVFYKFSLRFEYAFMGRFRNFFMPIFSNNNIFIGNGMIKPEIFLSGIPRIVLYFGIIGLFILLSIYIYIYYRQEYINKWIIFILLLSTLGTEIILGSYVVLYLPFIIKKIKSEDIIECKEKNF